ncbi:MAG: FtsX-like permease family protein [FCB group bacterium]|nr:FtsX-like permease family protein [FCB group bacterium]
MLEYIRSALSSLVSNKLRSSLTILGVIIGVWAIVSMQSIVAGFDRSMRETMAEFGTETFFIQKFPAIIMGNGTWRKYMRRKDLTYEDAIYLEENANFLRSAAASITNRAQTLKYRNHKTSPGVAVIGATAGYFVANATSLYEGRFFTKDDVHHQRNVIILGMDVADELFPVESPIGNTVSIRGIKFTVTGVLNLMPGFGSESPDNIVIIPITVYQKIFEWSSDALGLQLRALSSDVLEEALDEATSLMRIRRKVPAGKPNDFEIFTGDSIADTVKDLTAYVRIAALGIAGISLIVAGIGIMNIMLVAVLERTREIGTRKAIGARNSDILWQFLLESVILSEFGAFIGLGFGYLTAWAITSKIPQMTATVPYWSIISAVIYCSVIGISFGSFPARKASRLDPIDALRYE